MPMGRFGTPDEVAAVVVPVHDAACVTGVVVPVDGGLGMGR